MTLMIRTGRAPALMAVAVSLLILAQPVGVPAQTIPELLTDLERSEFASEAWTTAFLSLVSMGGGTYDVGESVRRVVEEHPDQRDRIATVLIRNLEQENVKRPIPWSHSPHHELYYALMGAVGSLNDPRALPALVHMLGTGAGASRAVAAFGEAAIPAVVARLESTDSHFRVRAAAAQTLSFILADRPRSGFSPERQELLISGVLRGLGDDHYHVRQMALIWLPQVADRRVREAVERIAREDPHAVERDGSVSYPVRGGAAKWLRGGGGHVP